MDIAPTTAPRSDQQNFDDYVAGPKTVTVADVTPGTSEQPVEVHLVEFPGRPYKPSKSMRRVLVAAWGSDSTPWAGRRIMLDGDPTVKFGGAVVGGIKIRGLSHIDKRLTVSLTVTRGKRGAHVVEPLPDAPAAPAPWTLADVNTATDPEQLRAAWRQATPDVKAAIEARVIEIQEAAAEVKA